MIHGVKVWQIAILIGIAVLLVTLL